MIYICCINAGRLKSKMAAPKMNFEVSHLVDQVEMAGIEPASERLDPQISTSVVGCACRPVSYNRQKTSPGHPLEPESSSFARLAEWRAALQLCDVRSCHRLEYGAGGRGSI